MNQRVQIIDGKLQTGDPDRLLEWIVRRPNGEPAEIGHYAGPAYVSGNKLNVARGVHLEEFIVDSKPTPESAQRDAGYRHGMKQKRHIWPGKRADESAEYADGWGLAWSERRRVEDNKKRWADEDRQAEAGKSRSNPGSRRRVAKRMVTKRRNPSQELHFANLTDLYRAAVAATKRSDALDRESQALADAGQAPDSAAIAKHTAYVAELKPWVDGQNWYAYNGEGAPLVRWPSAAKWFKPNRRANPLRKNGGKHGYVTHFGKTGKGFVARGVSQYRRIPGFHDKTPEQQGAVPLFERESVIRKFAKKHGLTLSEARVQLPALAADARERMAARKNPKQPEFDEYGHRIYRMTAAERRQREKEMKQAQLDQEIRDALRWEEIQEDVAFRRRLAGLEPNPSARRKPARTKKATR